MSTNAVDWNKVRQDFPVTERAAYLMSAAMSPLPLPVYRAVILEYKKLLLDGDIHWPADMSRFEALCGRLAGLINAGPEDITFAPNTSTLMSLLGLSFKQQARVPFNIVAMEDEFPASTIGLEHLGLPVRYVKPVDHRYPVEAILSLTDEQTLAVVTSYVQYLTGFRQDLEALGKELAGRNILLIVNATQAFPFYPLDVRAMHIDVLAASLHKWGLAGHVGSLFYTSPWFRKRFRSPLAGWLSVVHEGGDLIHTAKNVPFELLPSARRYDLGTFNLQPLLALSTALDYVEGLGLANIRARLKELTDHLIAGLESLAVTIVSPVAKAEERSAIVSFTLGEKTGGLAKTLEESRIYVSLRDGVIRVSVNVFNDLNDLDRLLAVVKAF